MTAALALLTSPWGLTCIALWLLVVAGLLRANRVAHRKPTPEPVFRITGPYPSCVPVHPRITQADVDATWASVWPSAVQPADIDTLEQRVYDRLFDDILAIEGLQ